MNNYTVGKKCLLTRLGQINQAELLERVGTSAIALLTIYILAITSFGWLSFSESWYESWIEQGLSNIYNFGFPFPPAYISLLSIVIGIGKYIGVDRYLLLRAMGMIITVVWCFALYSLCKNFGYKKIPTIMAICLGLSRFVSIDAYTNYDYTPFLQMLLVCSLALLVEETKDIKKGGLTTNKTDGMTRLIIWKRIRLVVSCLVVFVMVGSKQSMLPYAIMWLVCIYLFKRKDFMYYVTILAGVFAITLPILSKYYRGLEIITVFTSSEYKGGANNIFWRICSSVLSSITIDPRKLIVLVLMVIFIMAVLCIVESMMDRRHSVHFIISHNAFKLIILALGCVCFFALVATAEYVDNIFVGKTPLLLIFLILTSYKSKKDSFDSIIAVSVLCLVVALVNSMSGGMGIFDSTIPSVLLVASVGSHILEWKEDGFVDPHIKNILGVTYGTYMTIILVTQIAVVQKITEKGFSWWSIKENNISNCLDMRNWSNSECEIESSFIPGRSLMNSEQRKFVERVKSDYLKQKASDNRNVRKVLAFPHIPYFYSLLGERPYADTPVMWLDVLSTKSAIRVNKKIINELPDLIIYAFIDSSAYNDQTLGFGRQGSSRDMAFRRLNGAVISMVMDRVYRVADSYVNIDRTYGVFILKRERHDNTKTIYGKELRKHDGEIINDIPSTIVPQNRCNLKYYEFDGRNTSKQVVSGLKAKNMSKAEKDFHYLFYKYCI